MPEPRAARRRAHRPGRRTRPGSTGSASCFASMIDRGRRVSSTQRCPYKNRFDQCTAQFGCRNQRRPDGAGELRVCGGDDQLDYRSAWETARPSAPARRDRDMARPPAGRTLFDDADELGAPGADVLPAVRPLPRVRRRGARRAPSASARPTAAEAFLREPYRLACQAAVDRRRTRRSEFSVAAAPPAHRRPRAGGARCGRSTRRPRRRRRRAPTATSRSSRFAAASTASRSTSGRRRSCSSSSTSQTGGSSRSVAIENPQRFGGSDVMNRISYDEGPGHGRAPAGGAAGDQQGAAATSTTRRGVDRREVYEAVVVGNSTMRDLFFGLDVASIGQRPYKSLTELELLDGHAGRRPRSTARPFELGLHDEPAAAASGRRRSSRATSAPTSRPTSSRSASTASPATRSWMLVDVGTNTEVVVARRARIVAASCPAGPAFEGGARHVRDAGVRRRDRVAPAPRRRHVRATRRSATRRPVGICGSGLIDLLAELRRAGRMTPKGVVRRPLLRARRSCPRRGSRSRGPMPPRSRRRRRRTRSASGSLLRHLGVDPGDVDRLYLAGGFATYVDVAQRHRDRLPRARARRSGSSRPGTPSLRGARELLLSASARRAPRGASFAGSSTSSSRQVPDFFELFVDGCQLVPIPTRLKPADDRRRRLTGPANGAAPRAQAAACATCSRRRVAS